MTFVFGMAWLAFALSLTLQQTLEFGLYPFVVVGIVKAVFAAAVMRLIWLGVHRADAHKGAE